MNSPSSAARSRVAVVGSGVAGMTAAYLLSRAYDVTVFEQDDRLGGHVHTHRIVEAVGRTVSVDSGFIVHNDRTYPLLGRLFRELGIVRHPTEMSMSIVDRASGLEYAGGRGVRGVLAHPRRALDPQFLRLLVEVRRFHRLAARFLATGEEADQTTYGEFLAEHGFSNRFIDLFAIPVVSCVWSMGAAMALEYPAQYLFRFLDNHGMLAVSGSPQWFTVVGGASTYIDAIVRMLPDVRSGRRVNAVRRGLDHVEVTDSRGDVERFDRVVVATHPDQALALLADATEAESTVLGAIRYSSSEVILHTDERLLPHARNARASWNYLTPSNSGSQDAPVVTYWMNRLQGIESDREYLVTLNAREHVDPNRILAVMNYQHPIYDASSLAAQGKLRSLATQQTVFAGAYHGWGFHEDGCRSGVAAAEHFGVRW